MPAMIGEVDFFLLKRIGFVPYDLVDDGSKSSRVVNGYILRFSRLKRGFSVLVKYGIEIVH